MPKTDAEEKIMKKFNLDSIDQIQDKPKDYIVKFNFKRLGNEAYMGGITMNDVAFSYGGEKPWLLDQIDFGVDSSSRIAVVGPNGVGKTTLIKLIMEELRGGMMSSSWRS